MRPLSNKAGGSERWAERGDIERPACHSRAGECFREHAPNRACGGRRRGSVVRLAVVAPDDIHDVLPLGELLGPPAHVRPEDYALLDATVPWVLFTMTDSGLARR